MDALLVIVRSFLSAYAVKEVAKSAFRTAKAGAGFMEKRIAMLDADETCDTLFGQLMPELQKLQQSGDLDDLLESMTDDEVELLKTILTERGLAKMLEIEPVDFADWIGTYRKTADFWTASQQVNRLRLSFQVASRQDWQAFLTAAAIPPSNVHTNAWRKALSKLQRQIEPMLDSSVNLDKLVGDVAHQLEVDARMACDAMGEKVVGMVKTLIERGMFDQAVVDLRDWRLKDTARDLARRVPQLQLVTMMSK